MKLGLLAVVAVAVLLLNFSESRIVSRCELRDELGKMIDLRRRLWERVLATVICELELRSDLNTTLVESFGMCIPDITNTTMVTDFNTTGVNGTNNDLNNTTAADNPATINSTINSLNPTFVSNSTSGMKRRRRDADSSSDEENTFSEEEHEEDHEEEHEEDHEEEHEEDSEMQDEDEMRNEEDAEPQNLFGLFQLSDRQFCDSGLCPSENMCQTWCTAFTDDDITDDIACVIDTGYWREIMSTASESCRRTWNFFEECD